MPGGLERAARDKFPAPRFSPTSLTTSTYVDNAGIFECGEDTLHFDLVQGAFRKARLAVHEVEKGLVVISHLGALFDTKRRTITHTSQRPWRTYLAGKALQGRRIMRGHILRI